SAHVEHETESRRHALVKPDVRNRHRQLDVAHSLAPNPRQSHFHTATIANDAFMFDPLVFPAGTFPVACRTETSFAEEAALLRLERPIIDRLRILNFALAP